MTTILLVDPRSSKDRVAALQAAHPGVEFLVPSSRDEIPARIADADAVFGTLSDAEFRAATKLRWIQSAGAGVEWLWRTPAIAESDVVVTNTRGAHAATIAEHAFGLLLSLTRALRRFDEYQRREEWARGQIAEGIVGLKGMTMGIVGFGNIGRAIARRARGFEMEVRAVDARPVPGNEDVADVWPLDRLPDLCRRADVVVVSAPLTPQTKGMIGREQLGLMREGSLLLAMSRGGIIQEPALVEALQSGRLAGAGLDVTETEPLPADDPLWRAPNLIITPHSSGTSRLTTELMWSIFSENVGHFVRDEPFVNLVDKRRGY